MTADLADSGPARQAAAQLEALASDLTERGFETRVSHNGGTPSLDVVSVSDSSVRETVTVAPPDDGTWWFCWSWSDRIACITDVEAASFKIAYVLTLRAGG